MKKKPILPFPTERHAKFDFSFGTIQFMPFPTDAQDFDDFPDHRVLVGSWDRNLSSRDNLAKADVYHYRFIPVSNTERRGLKTADAAEEVRTTLKKFFQEYFAAEGKCLVGGYKESINRVLQWHFNPSEVKRTNGTVQLIHGVSSGDRSQQTNNFELYFKGGIQFTMSANKVGRLTPLYFHFGSYSGKVSFANREYMFRLHSNNDNWNGLMLSQQTEQELRSYFEKMNRLAPAMLQETAAKMMRKHICTLFPFIEDYNMLGEFTFFPLLSVDEVIASWKDINAKGIDT